MDKYTSCKLPNPVCCIALPILVSTLFSSRKESKVSGASIRNRSPHIIDVSSFMWSFSAGMSLTIAHMNDEKICCTSEDCSDTLDVTARGSINVIFELSVTAEL